MEQTGKRTNKPILIAAVVLVVLLAVVGIVLATRPQETQQGDKSILVGIYHGEALQREVEISTDAEFLRGALDEQGLIAGDEGELGIFVKVVDGVAADEAKQEWWCFTKAGEQLFTGVDDTPIANGDAFEITLTTGW